MLDWIARLASGTRRGRYWISMLSNRPGFQPIFNVMAARTEAALRWLYQLGFRPDIVVDVGAYRGEWTTMALRVFPEAHFVMIEAQASRQSDLRRVSENSSGRARFTIAVAGAAREPAVTFFLAETGSSLYPENTSFPQQTTRMPMSTLDDLLEDSNGGRRCLIKLDVQGAELDVLAGAPHTLERTDAILMEMSVVEYNRGAPRLAEVIFHMKKLGFLLFDISDLRRIGPILAQVDAIFVRQGSAMETRACEIIQKYGPMAT